MIRLLMVLLVIACVIYLAKWLAARSLKKWLSKLSEGVQTKPTEIEGEKLVSCHTCKIFIPLSQAKQQNEQYYCQDHLPNP